jgi:hypothetical protein
VPVGRRRTPRTWLRRGLPGAAFGWGWLGSCACGLEVGSGADMAPHARVDRERIRPRPAARRCVVARSPVAGAEALASAPVGPKASSAAARRGPVRMHRRSTGGLVCCCRLLAVAGRRPAAGRRSPRHRGGSRSARMAGPGVSRATRRNLMASRRWRVRRSSDGVTSSRSHSCRRRARGPRGIPSRSDRRRRHDPAQQPGSKRHREPAASHRAMVVSAGSWGESSSQLISANRGMGLKSPGSMPSLQRPRRAGR